MRIRNAGMLLNASPCQNLAPPNMTCSIRGAGANAFIARTSAGGSRSRRVLCTTTSGDPRMQDVLPEGGVIRKLWIGETDKYRDHLLRLDPAEPAQPLWRRRFRRLHPQLRRSVAFARRRRAWLFHRRRDARRRRTAAARRCASRARPKPRSAWRSRGRVTASARRCCAARCSPRATAAFGMLHMACLAENLRMQQLARKFDAELRSISAASSAKSNRRGRRRCR